MKKLSCLLLLLMSAVVHAAPPAPQVTVGADLKRLRFDWNTVPDASRYELWFRHQANAAWRKVTDRPAGATYAVIAVSAHLLDWRGARYRLDACDASGCTPSPEIEVSALMRDTVGFFKSMTAPPAGRNFGWSVALSADGRTLAVGAGEAEGEVPQEIVVYLYRRNGSNWTFDGRLTTDGGRIEDLEGVPIALSGDGSVLVLGAPFTVDPTGNRFTGAAYVFRRVNGTWQREQKLVGPMGQVDLFGLNMDLSDDGERLALTYADQVGHHWGQVRLYSHASGSWQLEKSLPVRTGGSSGAQCNAIALSGNGQRLVRHCIRIPNDDSVPGTVVETYSAPRWTLDSELALDPRPVGAGLVDLNSDGTLLVASRWVDFGVWRWTDSGWTPDGRGGNLALLDVAGINVSMSRNGNYVVIGDSTDNTIGVGAIYPPFVSGPVFSSGIAYVYERRGGLWTRRQTLKANTPTRQAFGSAVALGDNGAVLAVGAKWEPSAASGIDGDQQDESAQSRGAVWLY